MVDDQFEIKLWINVCIIYNSMHGIKPIHHRPALVLFRSSSVPCRWYWIASNKQSCIDLVNRYLKCVYWSSNGMCIVWCFSCCFILFVFSLDYALAVCNTEQHHNAIAMSVRITTTHITCNVNRILQAMHVYPIHRFVHFEMVILRLICDLLSNDPKVMKTTMQTTSWLHSLCVCFFSLLLVLLHG